MLNGPTLSSRWTMDCHNHSAADDDDPPSYEEEAAAGDGVNVDDEEEEEEDEVISTDRQDLEHRANRTTSAPPK